MDKKYIVPPAVKGFKDKEKGYGARYEGIVFLSGKRTPFGRFTGSFSGVGAIELGVIASRAAIQQAGIKPDNIESVIFANVGASSGDAFFFPRHIGLYAGAPISTPCHLVQRICSSSFEAIAQGAEQIYFGKADFVLAGGSENLTQVPIAAFGGRMGFPLGRPNFVDYLWEAFLDTSCDCPMGLTAENLAKKYKITKQEADSFAILSQQRAGLAIKNGYLKEEIVPVTNCTLERDNLKPRYVKLPKGVEHVSQDEHPRPDTKLEKIASLPSVYHKDGVQTAANSCGIVDGASAMVLSSALRAQDHNLKPLGRLVASAASGVEPHIMGIGPVPSCQLAMQIAGLKLAEIDLVEINEAFAAQYIAVERELGLDRNKTNIDGGAIAYGHPYAATGTRLTMTLLYKLRRLGKRYGMASACIGGGQGMAVIVEAFQE
ncbi:MAG: thiolase family protein [Planctomycetota bacterium]|nr:thiolase family protein [Planctomycetota bacterium]